MNHNNNSKGFTIIELLIVIVIIGILVAITAVSYTGVTNGANTADAQTKARAVVQYATACQATTGTFPAIATGTIVCSQSTGLEMPSGITLIATAPSAGQQKTHLQYTTSGSTVTVGYWDSAKSPAGISNLTN